jgi:hypothetical protein
MGPPSYMRSAVNRNVIKRRMTVLPSGKQDVEFLDVNLMVHILTARPSGRAV